MTNAATDTKKSSNVIMPISMFGEDTAMAEKVFDEVERSGTKVVMKDNIARCVLMSPEEYTQLSDEYNDLKLLCLAYERMEHFDPSKLIPAEEVYRELGITEEELEDFDDSELELE